jgi:hypothetical protein
MRKRLRKNSHDRKLQLHGGNSGYHNLNVENIDIKDKAIRIEMPTIALEMPSKGQFTLHRPTCSNHQGTTWLLSVDQQTV